MNQTPRKLCRILAFIMAACVILWVCHALSRPKDQGSFPQSTNESIFGQANNAKQFSSGMLEETSSFMEPDSLSLETSGEFEQLKQELFEQLVSSNYLTQHAYFQDPEASGLIPCYPSFWDLSEMGWYSYSQIIKSLKLQLDAIDKTLLNHDQQFFYDLLSQYADWELAWEGMEHFLLLQYLSPDKGLMVTIPQKLNAFPFRTRQDVEDYLVLLSDLPRLFNDLTALCQEAAKEQLTFTDQWIQDASASCAPYSLTPEHNSLVASFSLRLSQLSELTPEEIAAYEARNQEAVTEYVIPAYQKLGQEIRMLPIRSMEYEGLCGQKNGRSYYHFLINRCSGTSYADVWLLMSAITEQLEQNTQILNELLSQFSGGQEQPQALGPLFKEPDQTLSFLEQEAMAYFPTFEDQANLQITVIPDNAQDSWNLPCLENQALDCHLSRRTLFLNQHTTDDQALLYSALSYVGFPGRHYRETYLAHNPDGPLLSLLSLPGWEKGWDLYGRSYAISFENGLTPTERRLARLTLSSFLAVHALIDIQVNYYGWNLEDVAAFLSQQYGLQDKEVAHRLYRSALYAPGECVTEYMGYLEIRQIKALAADHLGETFDEMAFHRFFLDFGPAPFPLIRRYLPDWLKTQRCNRLEKAGKLRKQKKSWQCK